jgi:hypothetical protein
MAIDRRQIRLRYTAVCATCAKHLQAGEPAWWDSGPKRAHCLEHIAAVEESLASAAAPPIELGTAGASARREFARRSARREERIRTAHPHIGGLILALSGDPQSTTAWPDPPVHGRFQVIDAPSDASGGS